MTNPTATATTVICSENLLLGVAVMSVAELGNEPSHACRECDVPLWLMWSYDNTPFAARPFCGEEAEAIRYCSTCDAPGCRNYALGYH